MSKVKNRDRAKPKSALNLAEHRAGVAPNSTLASANEEMQMQGEQPQGKQMHSEKMHAAPQASARKKDKQRFGHN
jgi:chorismate-pyruvate lyase